MRRFGEYALALVLDIVGAGGALLIGGLTWQVVRTPRPAPLPPDVLPLTGRTIDAAATALALTALAGVVAVLATRGWVRRVVGAVIAAAGAGLLWRAATATSVLGATRARALVREHHPTVPTDSRVAPHVSTVGAWPWLTLLCGVLVVLAGVLIAAHGHRFATLSARYENRGGAVGSGGGEPGATAFDGLPAAGAGRDEGTAPADEEEREAARTRAAATMWHALDQGDDPTDAGGGGARRE